jgi:hypothetical protein
VSRCRHTNVLGGQPQAHDLPEKHGGLSKTELEVSVAAFRDQATAAQPRQGYRRVGAGRDHEVRVGRQAVNEVRKSLMDGGWKVKRYVLDDDVRSERSAGWWAGSAGRRGSPIR